MAMEHLKVSREIKEVAPEYTMGAKLVAGFVSGLERLGLLPKRLSNTEAVLEDDLRAKTWEILSRVREPNPDEQKALEKTGWVFLQTKAISLDQATREHPNLLGYGYSDTTDLYDIVPPRLVSAIYRQQPDLSDSRDKPQDIQLQMIEKRSLFMQIQFPSARAVMLPAVNYTLQEIEYYRLTGGKRQLFPSGLSPRSLEEDVLVGRRFKDSPLSIRRIHPHYGKLKFGRAVPALVFIKN